MTGLNHRYMVRNFVLPTVPFTPTDIAGLVLWLDASNAGSITSSGSPAKVSQWNDLSSAGNNATQGTGANQPTTGTRTQNGLNVIDWIPASSTNMVTALTASSRTQSVFMVLLSDIDTAAGTAYTPLGDVAVAGGGGRQVQFCGFGVDRFRLVKDTVAALSVYDGVDPAASTAYVLVCAIGAANVVWSLNGAAEETDVESTTFTASLTSIIGATAPNNTGLEFWDGWIAEIVVYDTQLNSTNRDSVRQYLRNKWAVY